MRPCRACNLEHSPLVNCGVFRRQHEAAQAQLERQYGNLVTHQATPTVVVHTEPVVVHKPESVVVHTDAVVVHKSRHGAYKDQEARKAYKREWMRANRAKAAHA